MRQAQTNKSLRALKLAIALFSGAMILSSFTSKAKAADIPGTARATVIDGNTGKPTGEQVFLTNGSVTTPVTINVIPASIQPNPDQVAQMRMNLLAKLSDMVQTASLDDLAGIQTAGAQETLIVRRAISDRLNGAETSKLATLFKENGNMEIRLAIANLLCKRSDVDATMALELASVQPDIDEMPCIETNKLMATMVLKTIGSIADSDQVASAISGKPFYVRQVLTDELMKRGENVSTMALLTAFIQLGQMASSRPDLASAITDRPDCSAKIIATMIAALQPSSGKG